MIAPATASPAPRPPAVETEARAPRTTPLVPTPRVPPSAGDLALRLLYDGLAGLAQPAAPRTTRSRSRRPSGAGWAPSPAPARSATKSTATTSAAKDPLSFLKDPKLSIEEKLMRLLGYLNQKWEKEMQAKLDQIAAGEKGATAASSSKSSSSKKKSGGLLGSIGSAVSGLLGAVGLPANLLGNTAIRGLLGKLGGPVLAAAASALGFPALAPALLKMGPGVIDAVAGAVSSAGGKGGSAAGGSETSAATGSGMKDSERQQLVLEIQRITEKQKEMFGLVSNILKANHDMRSSIIGNIR